MEYCTTAGDVVCRETSWPKLKAGPGGLTCFWVEEEVAPVGVRLHEAPIKQFVDRAAQHQSSHVVANFLLKRTNAHTSQVGMASGSVTALPLQE